jgi:hypothetical protein
MMTLSSNKVKGKKMDNSETATNASGAPPPCPPSVPENLWALVPDSRKRAFLEAAALNLRRGVHPEFTVLDMLSATGIRVPDERAGGRSSF